MKNLIFSCVGVAAIMVGCSGCSLNKQVPKATIMFNPVTHAIQIDSHKDIELKDVTVEIATNGTSTIKIGSYKAQANIAVIEAAVKAQQQQISGLQEGLSQILAAAAKGSP